MLKELCIFMSILSISGLDLSAFADNFLTIEPKTTLDIFDMDAYTNDSIGYKLVNIGDLDNNGIDDLATIAFHTSYGYTKDNDSDINNHYGAIIILFMNDDGTVESSNRITIDDEANGLGRNCLDDPTRDGVGDDILARDSESLESISYLGNFINNNPTLAIGYSAGDYNGDESNTGDVLLVELSNSGNVNSCTKLTEIVGYSNDGSLGIEYFFGKPIITTDIDSDGILDLIVGNNGLFLQTPNSFVTDLLIFLLDNDGTIKQTNVIWGFIFGMTPYDQGLESGTTIDGERKIAVGLGDVIGGDDGFFILNLLTNGELDYSSKITSTEMNHFGFTVDDQQNSIYDEGPFDMDDDSDGSSDAFGNDLVAAGDLDGDGIEDLMVGAFNDDDPFTDAGSIYFLLLNSEDSIKEVYKLSHSTITPRASFGHSITLLDTDSKLFAVGAPNDDTNGENTGIIYIYDFEDFPFIDTPQEKDELETESPIEEETEDTFSKKNDFVTTPKLLSDFRSWMIDKEKFVDGINHFIMTGDIDSQIVRAPLNYPDWVINYLSEKWFNDQISDKVYFQAIEYLIDMKIIK